MVVWSVGGWVRGRVGSFVGGWVGRWMHVGVDALLGDMRPEISPLVDCLLAAAQLFILVLKVLLLSLAYVFMLLCKSAADAILLLFRCVIILLLLPVEYKMIALFLSVSQM